MQILAVGIGGALGALLRAIILLFSFPFPLVFINAFGSFLLAYLLTRDSFSSSAWKLLLTTGMLGSFTTFSSFSAEALQLLQSGALLNATLYIVGTLAVGILCSFVGFIVGGGIWRS